MIKKFNNNHYYNNRSSFYPGGFWICERISVVVFSLDDSSRRKKCIKTVRQRIQRESDILRERLEALMYHPLAAAVDCDPKKNLLVPNTYNNWFKLILDKSLSHKKILVHSLEESSYDILDDIHEVLYYLRLCQINYLIFELVGNLFFTTVILYN
ncbi:hypothetical protein H8356DRAFT_1427756 [Neocallimastix lanati (nom. inval.)]|nr:hypothetical protein H8356DRAFT_1427756 [Neocallimastix sp. JGI-2020a]